MTRWQTRQTLATLTLAVLGLGILTPSRPMPAVEIDALAGGGALVDAIFDDV